MRVGIDGRYAEGNLTGIGKYIYELVVELSKEGIMCTIFYSKPPLHPIKAKNINTVILKTDNKYVFEHLLLPKYLFRKHLDIFHSPSNLGIPFPASIPVVLTVHDLIPLETKKYFSKSKFSQLSFLAYFLRQIAALSIARSVITVSKFTRDRLIANFSWAADKTAVVYSGVGIDYEDTKLPGSLAANKYLLNCGGIERRKNIKTLISAFKSVSRLHSDLSLVVTGVGEGVKDLQDFARKIGVTKKIIFLGYVDEKTYSCLVKKALAVIYTSLQEGFGRPIVEAMKLDTPILVSDIEVFREIGDSAALYVNPKSKKSIGVGIRKLVESKTLRDRLTGIGRKQALRFNVGQMSREVVKIYKKIV